MIFTYNTVQISTNSCCWRCFQADYYEAFLVIDQSLLPIVAFLALYLRTKNGSIHATQRYPTLFCCVCEEFLYILFLYSVQKHYEIVAFVGELFKILLAFCRNQALKL